MGSRFFYWCPNAHPGSSKRVFHTRDKVKRPYYCPVCKQRFTKKQMIRANGINRRLCVK